MRPAAIFGLLCIPGAAIVGLVAIVRAAAPHVDTCVPAVIWRDGTVTIDRDCVHKLAASYRPSFIITESIPAWAYTVDAIFDGRAQPVHKTEKD